MTPEVDEELRKPLPPEGGTPNDLLRRVKDAPTSQAARLALAEWCDRNGSPHKGEMYRSGNICLDWFDDLARQELGHCQTGINKDPVTLCRVLADRLSDWDMGCCTPRQYCYLWIYLHRYRRSVRNAEIRREAALRFANYCHLVGEKKQTRRRRRRRR